MEAINKSLMLSRVEIARQVEAKVNEEADALSADRKVKTFTDDDLQITLGFQFSAIDQGKTGLQIFHLDVDSSITSASLEREADREPAAVVQMAVAMINAIDPKLRGFKNVVRAKLPMEQIQKLNEVAQAHCPVRFRQLPP